MRRVLTVGLIAAWLSAPVFAQVQIDEPWVRGTVPQQRATGAFMRLTAEKAARLVDAQSPVAGLVEVHEMAMEGDVMKMRRIAALELPAGETVELKPGGYHVMLMQLQGQVKAGDEVPVTLVFEDVGSGERFTQTIAAPAVALGAAMQQDGAGMSGHGRHQHQHQQ